MNVFKEINGKRKTRILNWIVCVILGFACLYHELKSIKTNIFLEDIFRVILIVLFVLSSIIQILSDVLYHKTDKRLVVYLPSFSLIVIWGLIIFHASMLSYGSTRFSAYTDEINHGVLLDFRSDNKLKVTQFFKFGEVVYWGKYSQSQDTLRLNIKTDFILGHKAVIKGDTLRFKNDTVFFLIEYPK